MVGKVRDPSEPVPQRCWCRCHAVFFADCGKQRSTWEVGGSLLGNNVRIWSMMIRNNANAKVLRSLGPVESLERVKCSW